MSKKIFIPLFVILFFTSFFLVVNYVYSDSDPNAARTITLNNPLGKGATAQSVIGQVISQVLGVVGALALLMFIYGGLIWMTAMGNDQSIKKGKDILMWSSIGLIVIFSSYALVKFVLQAIGV